MKPEELSGGGTFYKKSLHRTPLFKNFIMDAAGTAALWKLLMSKLDKIQQKKKPRKTQTPVIKSIIAPKSGTKASSEYFESYIKINRFLNWVAFMAVHIDTGAEIAQKALYDTGTYDDKKIEELQSRKKMIDELKNNRQFLLENILARHVENYLNYLSSLLNLIFIKRPETLRSSRSVELDFVLNYSNMSDLIEGIAEKTVETLAYKSFTDLFNYFMEKFKISIIEQPKLNIIIEAIETRNLSIHNRCIINNRYISKTDKPAELLGKERNIGIDYVEDISLLLAKSVRAIDSDARKRLKIKGIRFNKNNMTVPL